MQPKSEEEKDGFVTRKFTVTGEHVITVSTVVIHGIYNVLDVVHCVHIGCGSNKCNNITFY